MRRAGVSEAQIIDKTQVQRRVTTTTELRESRGFREDQDQDRDPDFKNRPGSDRIIITIRFCL